MEVCLEVKGVQVKTRSPTQLATKSMQKTEESCF